MKYLTSCLIKGLACIFFGLLIIFMGYKLLLIYILSKGALAVLGLSAICSVLLMGSILLLVIGISYLFE